MIQDVIDQLLDAGNRIAAAEHHAAKATTELANAERILAHAIDGADDLSLITRLTPAAPGDRCRQVRRRR